MIRARLRSRLPAALALLATASLLGGACADARTEGRGSPAPPGGGGANSTLLPTSPTALPHFDLATFRELLVQLRGAPVVVNVWASWCGPCAVEAPELAAVAAEYEGRVQFVGVDIQDSRGPAREFIIRYGWPYPSVFDQTGAIRDGLGFIGQPVTVVYDADGNEVHVFSGATTADQLREQIEAAIEA